MTGQRGDTALIAVKAGTILVDERLCADRLLGRMRFTLCP